MNLEKFSKIAEIVVFTILIGIIVLMALCIPPIIMNPYYAHNEMFTEEIMKLNETEEFVFNDIVPFEWDAVYSFEPGTSKYNIEKALGFENPKIKDVPYDGDNHIIFVKDNQITAYPNVLNEKLSYKFNFYQNEDTYYSKIEHHQYPVFYVETIDGKVNITDMEVFLKEGYPIGSKN